MERGFGSFPEAPFFFRCASHFNRRERPMGMTGTATEAEGTKVAAKAADDYVRANPWAAVGLAAALGLLLGILVARR